MHPQTPTRAEGSNTESNDAAGQAELVAHGGEKDDFNGSELVTKWLLRVPASSAQKCLNPG